jgi:uncharacterized 2Fe-2S/4Fe-4S cluster protein (DUF4445 family)
MKYMKNMKHTVKITFTREKVEIEVPEGTNLLSAMRGAGIFVETPCNGAGLCGKCLVDLDGRPQRACSCVVTRDVRVTTPPSKGKIVSADEGISAGWETDDRDRAHAHENSGMGLAVDLGTTVISACLADLRTGETAARASCLNPQTEYGGDVLTRAGFCRGKPENLKKLRDLVLQAINGLVEEMIRDAEERRSIRQVSLAGNTIMEHIFAGFDPTPLTGVPFQPAFEGALELPPSGLRVAPDARVFLAPCVSAFVGGDITAGIAASGFTREKGNGLFIDIGTNGEIVLRLRGKMYGTSTAAGPAFEGMNISCGVRAVPGAIERVFTDETGKITFETIDGLPPVGVCGSGLLDLTAALLRTGIIDETGFMARCPDGQYPLAEGLALSQKDVRQVQLAKGAVAAGVTTLLTAAGASYEELDSLSLAGAFSFHLNLESLKTIGLIDPRFRGTARFIGNTSLEGARLSLLSRKFREELLSAARKIKPVELSGRSDFQENFLKAMQFPRL